MDSINNQQQEKNHEDLYGFDATKRIQEMTGKNSSCFFCSNIKTGIPLSVRPMSVLEVDDDGNLWFLSASDSHKNMEIETDPFVHLLFQGSKYSDFLNIYGIASVNRDQAKIRELWSPLMKTWFTEGEDDQRISVIKVEPTEGYYWDNKHGNAISFMKIVAGALIGKTLDDSIEGKLTV